MIELSDVTKTFGTKTLFTGLNYEFPSSAVTAITGTSGCGKSTLLNCIGALMKPDAGHINVITDSSTVDVTSLGNRGQRRYRHEFIGYLFQDYALIDDKSVAENVKLVLDAIPRAEHKSVITKALEQVGLSGYEQRIVFELSGGEQQRVGLARLLAKNPAIILADEPTGALDPGNAEMVLTHLRRFADQGATVIIATHDPQVVAMADNHLTLNAIDQFS